MNRRFRNFTIAVPLLAGAVAALITNVALGAGVNFAAEPLSVQAPIPPNLLFIIDDSGSMDWQYMPDGIGGDCNIDWDEDMRDKPVYCQSPYYNKIYYNPDFVYTAPVDAQGDSFPDIDPSSAPYDGFDTDRGGAVDLTNWDSNSGSSSGSGSNANTEGCEFLYYWGSKRSGWYCDAGYDEDDEYRFVASYEGENLYQCLEDVEYRDGGGSGYRLWRAEGEFNANYGQQGGGSSSGQDRVLEVKEERRNTGYYCDSDDVEDKTYICTGTPRRATSGDRHWLLEDQGSDPTSNPSALYADDFERSGSGEWWYCRDDDVERAYNNCDKIKEDTDNRGSPNERLWAVNQSSRPNTSSLFYEHNDQKTGWYCDDKDDLDKVRHCRGEPQLYTGNGSSEEWWLVNYNPISGDGDDEDEGLLCGDTGGGPSTNAFYYYRYDSDLPSCNSNDDEDTDCYTKVTVTDAQELQNAANWFSYYRSRILTAKTGASLAFDALNSSYRLGFGSLNQNNTLIEGLDSFGSQREQFYGWLHGVDPSGGTPLRRALDDAGQYFSGAAPYRRDINDSSSEQLSCQQNFAILMTDGYWNGDSADSDSARADNDSRDGPIITSESGQRFQFKENTEPFDDNTSNTLADVAMYYWNRDLREDLANNVPFSESNPAFWQHMVTIGVGLGVEGDVTKNEAFAAVDSGQNINWGNPGSNDAAKIDDLLHAAVNSRGDFFSARDPAEFIQNLIAALGTVQTRVASGTSPAVNSAQVSGERLLYRATYRSGDWSGSLSAFGFDANLGEIDAKQWSANFPDPADRKIFTTVSQGNSLTGAEFVWGALDADAKAAFGSNDGGVAERIVSYLRGDQSGEVSAGGDFRTRANGILADIIHTSPIYVGPPNGLRFRYTPWAEASAHNTFASTNADRVPVVYVSANNGMLHAFHGETGAELFAYLPRAAILKGVAELSDPDYTHSYYNDGPLAAYDVYLGSDKGWRTVLVGSFGRDSRGVFALDITDPENFDETDILWEITGESNGAVGEILSEATVTRLVDGTWVAIFGNGYNSDTNQAGLLVVDIATGNVKVIGTGTGSSINANGLAGPLAWDVSVPADFNSDTVYAGDLLGNVWKFDLSLGFDALDTRQTPTRVFAAVNRFGQAQPITTRLLGVSDPEDRLWLFFGTGRLFNADDIDASGDVQSWYGLSVDAASTLPLTRDQLKARGMTDIDVATENESRFTALREADVAVAGDMEGKLGWYIDFDLTSGPGERILSPNLFSGGAIVSSSYIPIADTCSPGGTGYVMAVDPFTGAALEDPFFDLDGDNEFNNNDIINRNRAIIVAGISFGDVPSKPIFVDDQLVTQLEDGSLENVLTPPNQGGAASPLQRMSWREIRR